MINNLSLYVIERVGETVLFRVIGYLTKGKPKPTFVQVTKGTAEEFFKNNPDKLIVPAWKVIQRLRTIVSSPNIDKGLTASVIADLIPHLNISECAVIGKALLNHHLVRPILICVVIIILVQIFNNRYFIFRVFSENGCHLKETKSINNMSPTINRNNNLDLSLLANLLKAYLDKQFKEDSSDTSDTGLSQRDILLKRNRNNRKSQADLLNLVNNFIGGGNVIDGE